MTTFLLTYDLNDEDTSAAYKPLIDELKRLGAHKYQFSCWLLNANNTAVQVKDHFQYLDANDAIFVSELVANHSHRMSKAGTTDWIKAHPPAR